MTRSEQTRRHVGVASWVSPRGASAATAPQPARATRRSLAAVALAGALSVGAAAPGLATPTPAPTPSPSATATPTDPPPVCEGPAPTDAPTTGASATPAPTPTATLPQFREGDPVGGEQLSGRDLVVDLPEGVPAPPAFRPCSWIIADLNSGEVIAARAPHAQYMPASTIKALTALAVIDRLPADQEVTGEYEDAAVDGTKVGIEEGAGYPVQKLLEALMLASANDAAVALARANGGMEATTEQMNELAHHLGALDTTAKNTSGLDAEGQLTSAYDLALIGRAAVNHEKLAPILVARGTDFPGGRTEKGETRGVMQIGNHNRLLWNYEGTIGVKNGYTIAAQSSYVGAVRRGDRGYVIAYMKSDSGKWRETAAMLDWAFAHGESAKPVGQLVNPGELSGDDNQGHDNQEHDAAPAARPEAAANVQQVPMSGLSTAAVWGLSAAVVLGVGTVVVRLLRRR